MSSIQTQLIHAGEPRPRLEGSVVPAIFQSATFEDFGLGDYHDLKYIRLNNTPNHDLLHKKLAKICCGEAALVTSSGMAAISSTLLALLASGDHILAQDCLYGGTHGFLDTELPSLGIAVDRIDAGDSQTWQQRLRPETRLIYVESITNPLIQVCDLEAIVSFARDHNLLTVIDNTFASPVNFLPLELGFDVEIHSATKYLNGHSDIVAGAIIASGDLVSKIGRTLDHLGGCLDPHACFLLHRGMRTLSLRVEYQNKSAEALARRLQDHPGVECVHYPLLEGNPDFDRAHRLFNGCGGVFSFEPAGGVEAAKKILGSVKLAVNAPSLGGVETLIGRPSAASHASVPPSRRKQLGIADHLLRIAVGIEDTEDLWSDLEEALSQ